MVTIRLETPEEISAIHQIHLAAFPTAEEAKLVDALRKNELPLLSLVAELDHNLVGHLLFSPVSLNPHSAQISIFGLAPLAVIPAHQNQGIGSMLVKEGLMRCRELGFDAVVVLGQPWFYPKFNFVPSINFEIQSEYEVPDEVFMMQELKKGALHGIKGTVKYHPIFNEMGV